MKCEHVTLAGVGGYRVRIEGEFGGARDAAEFWHTDAYEFRDARWQVVWSQAARIREKS